MKKIILITLLLIPFFGFSQTTKPIDGFLGIKFGSSKAVVLAAVRAKGGVANKANSDATSLAFTNVKLGLRTSAAFLVKFINDKAYEADYIFEPDVEAKVISDYNSLVNDITAFYGQGNITKNYTFPYKDGDDNTLLGLSAGKIDYHTTWPGANNNLIWVGITTDMVVELIYQDGVLTKLAIEHQKTKESSDY